MEARPIEDRLSHDKIVEAIADDIMTHPRLNKPLIENLITEALDRRSKKELLDFWDLGPYLGLSD